MGEIEGRLGREEGRMQTIKKVGQRLRKKVMVALTSGSARALLVEPLKNRRPKLKGVTYNYGEEGGGSGSARVYGLKKNSTLTLQGVKLRFTTIKKGIAGGTSSRSLHS